MRTTFATSWRPRARGLTLIECVVATALLGTLLVSVLLADGRMRHQAKRAELRAEACEIADGLLAKWWKKKDTFPRSDQGPVKGSAGWRWRTRIVANPAVEDLDGEAIAAPRGETLVAVLLARGALAAGTAPRSNLPRGPYCMIGTCFGCLVEIEGVGDRRACLTPVREGLSVRRRAGPRDPLA